MIPPTSIDGTDITGATIDGTDVQEITVDGDVVFSASLDPNTVLTDRWPLDEGSGSLANNILGTVDMDINGNFSWDSGSEYTGGAGVEFNNNTGFIETQSTIGVPVNDFSVMFWTRPISQENTFPDFTRTSNGEFRVFDAFDRNSWHVNIGGDNQVESQGSFTEGEWYFIAYTGSGNTWDFYVYETNGQTLDRSGSISYDNFAQSLILGNEAVSNSIVGYYDDLMVNQNTQLSESTITEIWDATRQGR